LGGGAGPPVRSPTCFVEGSARPASIAQLRGTAQQIAGGFAGASKARMAARWSVHETPDIRPTAIPILFAYHQFNRHCDMRLAAYPHGVLCASRRYPNIRYSPSAASTA
jgi:hypothetical protein